MQVFTFNCANSRLRRYSSGLIYAGSYPNTVFKFNFNTPDWGVSSKKIAVFSCHGENHPQQLDENGMCRVPNEVLHEGDFFVSVNDGNGLITNNVRVPVESKQDNTTIPDMDDESDSDVIKILDGGQISEDLADDPSEDDKPNSSDEKDIINYITTNKVPFYIGIVGEGSSAVSYVQLDTSTANYTDQGFYITTNNDGKITNAGYQINFEGNTDNRIQTFAICAAAKIVAAYQYQPSFNQWLDMGFDGVYWVEDETVTEIVNGKQVTYTTYAYNVDLMGDTITAPEYWRFEVEVL